MLRRVPVVVIQASLLVAWADAAAMAEQYTAFSLRVARQRIERGGDGWRGKEREVLNLGGINELDGFVYDANNRDLILVGRRQSDRADLAMDDLVVALRARFRQKEWPLVSIDPAPKTGETEMQRVRFEGGVEDTPFGQAMYDADYRLKQLAIGVIEPGIVGFRTAWDREMERLVDGISKGQYEVSSRFWFYPSNSQVVIREGVCVSRGSRVSVFTEVLSASIDGKKVEDVKGWIEGAREAFARDVSQQFDKLCRVEASFNRLRGLEELVSLSRALEEMIYPGGRATVDLGWWLDRYRVARARTPREARLIRRKDGKGGRWLEVSGGVHLAAVAMKLNSGNVEALRTAVLAARPAADTLKWQFISGEWIVPLGRGQVRPEDISALFGEALFLDGQERFADSVALYDRMLDIDPRLFEAWGRRGLALDNLGRPREALTSYERALEINPVDAAAWANKGVALGRLGRWNDALKCHDRSIEIDPDAAGAWSNKGKALANLDRPAEALECLDHAIGLDGRLAGAWSNKCAVLGRTGRLEEALKCCDLAIEANPRLASAWYNRGRTLEELRRWEEALEAYDRSIEIHPRYSEAWLNRCSVIGERGRTDEELRCYDRAIEIDPRAAGAWSNKGMVLGKAGRFQEALRCFDRAIKIDPRLESAWTNKGAALWKLSRFADALRCFDRAVEIDPQSATAWLNKGRLLEILGRTKEAKKCLDRAAEIDPKASEYGGR